MLICSSFVSSHSTHSFGTACTACTASAVPSYRYGKLIRADIPAMKPGPRSIPYAFIEYRSDRDAEAAYKDMHGHYFDGMRLRIEVSRWFPLHLPYSG